MNIRATLKAVREEIIGLIEPVILQEGMELVDVEYKPEGGQWVLRVYIDKEGGVTIDDCVGISRELSNLLDIKDFIPHKYSLEVSSPGLDRPLVKEADFLKNKGKKAKVKASECIDNRKRFTGVLEGVNGDKVVLRGGQGEIWKIPFEKIEKARLVVDLND